jgi:hypothetical protein
MKNDVYVALSLGARPVKRDADGNYIFEVEASNENLDLQNQVVLQDALLKSAEHFLKNGVISLDHLHKRRGADGQEISDMTMVIGEPVDVRAEGRRTIVKGKLYGNNKHARAVARLLRAGSTRVKASVGGVMPKYERGEHGEERVTRVLWNDMALTCAPVNATVGAARFSRAISGAEFVKSLSAAGSNFYGERELRRVGCGGGYIKLRV